MLDTNRWMVLNSITYKIHAIEVFDKMRLEVMRQMGFLFDFDSASFYTVVSKENAQLGRPVGINYSLQGMNDYLQVFKNIDYSKGLMATGKNIAYRESDILPDSLRKQTEYYKKVYDVQNWHFSMHLNISFAEKFLGVMSFFRQKGKKDFMQEDVFALDMLKDHLALRLYQELLVGHKGELTLEACYEKFQLTAREGVILKLLVDGLPNQKISEQLMITNNTLKKHILNIYKKMGVNSRGQLFQLVR